mgnify:CR=1 FL=1
MKLAKASPDILLPGTIYNNITRHIKGRILDIGTGDGHKLKNIIKGADFNTIKQVVAIEPSPVYKKARENLKDLKKVEILNVTIEDISIYRYKIKFSNGSKYGYLREYFTALLKSFYLFHKVLIKTKKIDVIHVANPPDIFWILAIYSKLFKIKFIFDEHDLTPETFLSLYDLKKSEGGIFFKILNTFQLLSYKFSDAIISTNESYRKIAT